MASPYAKSIPPWGSRSNATSACRSAKSLPERSLAGQPADADQATIAAPVSATSTASPRARRRAGDRRRPGRQPVRPAASQPVQKGGGGGPPRRRPVRETVNRPLQADRRPKGRPPRSRSAVGRNTASQNGSKSNPRSTISTTLFPEQGKQARARGGDPRERARTQRDRSGEAAPARQHPEAECGEHRARQGRLPHEVAREPAQEPRAVAPPGGGADVDPAAARRVT